MQQSMLFPERLRLFSGSGLKLLAVLAMLIDHCAFCLSPLLSRPLFTFFGRAPTAYWLMRCFGRIAFPLFCFLLTEGYRHTRNRSRYAMNLLVFALLSELPFNLFQSGSLFFGRQNVMFTLLLGYLAIWAAEQYRDQLWIQVPLILGLFLLSLALQADYGWTGFCFILLLYYLGQAPLVQALGCSALLSWPYGVGLAFVPINLYNGKRGFIRGPLWKALFYAFYPVHMILLWLLRKDLLGA